MYGIFRPTHSSQVLTGQLPFPGFVGLWSMMQGGRPLRSDHPEIPAPLWDTIERCWHNVPSERISAGEALNLLEEESRRISTPKNDPAPSSSESRGRVAVGEYFAVA